MSEPEKMCLIYNAWPHTDFADDNGDERAGRRRAAEETLLGGWVVGGEGFDGSAGIEKPFGGAWSQLWFFFFFNRAFKVIILAPIRI